MRKFTLVQIGDVHLSEHQNELVGDIKDKSLPTALVASVAPQKLRLVIRGVLDICEKQGADGIFICGDLATRGDLAEYERCVNYLSDALNLLEASRWPQESLHAVPGNHDVNRTLCGAADLLQKFGVLKTPWSNIKLPILATDSVRRTDVPVGDGGVALYSLNSCIGCGETRLLPDAVARQLKDVLDSYAATVDPATAFALVGEQLDTPAFLHEHVEELTTSVKALSDKWAALVLAHHNMLPQAIPRVAVYTEVVNGGLVRSRLSSCPRPVIYCHGHIHADPIEVVQDQRHQNGKVVTVSAPLLVDGFNVITLYFSRSNYPIGCEITCLRLLNDGDVAAAPPIRICLVSGDNLSKYRDDAMHDLLRVIGDATVRFEELRTAVNDGRETQLKRPTIADALLEAEWLQLIDIRNRDDEPKHWQLRRRMP